MGKYTDRGFVEYRHLHVTNEPALGGVTFRFDVDYHENEVNISWATCSDKDNFCRKTGRELADDRAERYRVSTQYDRDRSLVDNASSALFQQYKALKELENKTDTERYYFHEIERCIRTMHGIATHYDFGSIGNRAG